MRWERLFDDLTAQAEAADAAELQAEVSERTRYELGRLMLRDRMRAALGREVTLGCGPTVVVGRVLRVAADAVLVADARGEVVVPLAAVEWAAGLGRAALPEPEGPPRPSLGLRALLRDLARDRVSVSVLVGDGSQVPWRGRVEAVGADTVDLTELDGAGHSRDRLRVVALAAIRAVRID